jgi:hypothetical protein
MSFLFECKGPLRCLWNNGGSLIFDIMFTLPPPPPFCLVPCVPALGDECSQLDESVIVEEFVSHPSLESLCKRSPADREGVLRKKISYRSARKDELK